MDKLVPQKFTLQGHEYLVGRLDLFESMKLQKRLGPLMPTAFNNVLYEMWTAYGQSVPESKASLSDKLTEFGTLLAVCQPLLDRIAQMSDADFDFCVKTALSVVERRSEGGKNWVRVYADGALAFDDIDFPTTCVLVSAVVQRELRPFIDALNL